MTGDPVLGGFEGLRDAYYPGSKQVRRSVQERVEEDQRERERDDENDWDEKPIVKVLNGVETEFFHVGALAQALGREVVTIRLWERKGIIPLARFRSTAKRGAGRRLYTRAQIEGIIRIAEEEGILGTRRVNDFTRFTERVLELWARV